VEDVGLRGAEAERGASADGRGGGGSVTVWGMRAEGPERSEFLSEEDLDLRNLSEEELPAWWWEWFRAAQATNDLDDREYSATQTFVWSAGVRYPASPGDTPLRLSRYLPLGRAVAYFARRGALLLGELNAIHHFPEGNGRTQREFMSEVALKNGYALDWSRVPKEKMTEASRESFRSSNSSLEQALLLALDNERNRKLERQREDDRER
jgi:hypothetical protein